MMDNKTKRGIEKLFNFIFKPRLIKIIILCWIVWSFYNFLLHAGEEDLFIVGGILVMFTPLWIIGIIIHIALKRDEEEYAKKSGNIIFGKDEKNDKPNKI